MHDSKKGKYLTFTLSGEEYGIAIQKVKEIIGLMDITEVPNMPSFVKGVINLRDHVILIVDLRKKFSMPEAEFTDRTCIIVVESQRVDSDKGISTIGIIVDGVSEVVNIQEEQIEEAPSFSAENDTHFILGMAKMDGKVKILLDIDKVLTSNEMIAISDTI